MTIRSAQKTFFYLIASLLALSGLLFIAGCDNPFDSGSSGPKAVGTKISGNNWSGFFLNTETGTRESLTATVTQDGDAVTITTTKDFPPAQMFTGTISSNSTLRLTDASDGEVWSTHFGPATNNFIKVADFLEAPMGADDPTLFPLAILELSR